MCSDRLLVCGGWCFAIVALSVLVPAGVAVLSTILTLTVKEIRNYLRA